MTTWRRRRRGDRGAVAVEFALVAPLLIMLLLGIVEVAFLMKDHVSMSSSVRAGARTASAAADAGPGTCQASSNPPPCSPASVPAFAQAAADTMQRAGMAMPSDDIDWVIIYRAGTNGFPEGQSSLVCGSNCVRYIWDAGLDKFRYASGSWASASVNACLNDKNRHSVGVGMQATHTWVTGIGGSLFSGAQEMQEHTVMQFEPLEQDMCGPNSPNPHK